MFNAHKWGDDLGLASDPIGLEAFVEQISQSKVDQKICPHPFFNPVNIIADEGLYYANIYACQATDGSDYAQKLAIWFSSLKDTDYVHLTVSSLILDIPLVALISLMSAVASTKAKVDIHLDSIVCDNLAYFYLLTDKVTVGDCGALFVPSYVDQRSEDTSVPWKAVHDFYMWLVEEAVRGGRLTEEEGERLHRGSSAVIPTDRFAEASQNTSLVEPTPDAEQTELVE